MDRNNTDARGRSDRLESLPGHVHTLTLEHGHTATLYCVTPPDWERAAARSVPLLVVHSINATASAFEMEPLVTRQAAHRPVIALDLPGFGAASKPDQRYPPALMQQAIRAAIDWIARHLNREPIDVVALSLGCEFATEVVLQRPDCIRTLALISPTGMEGRRVDEHYQGGATRESTLWRRLLRHTRLGRGLYRVLTSRPSIRWFLARSWGSRDFDQRLLAQGLRCAALPGAHHAPLDFVAGALFTRGIIERYRALPVPVWVAQGTEGAFTDFGACPTRTGSVTTGGTFTIERAVFETGAMPHFQLPDAFNDAYERFLRTQPRQSSASQPTTWPDRAALLDRRDLAATTTGS